MVDAESIKLHNPPKLLVDYEDSMAHYSLLYPVSTHLAEVFK